MSLLNIIRKRNYAPTVADSTESASPVATATVATVATLRQVATPTVASVATVASPMSERGGETEPTVASVATVAVAKPLENATAPRAESIPRYCWLIHFADRDPMFVTFSSMATHEEVLKAYPDALAAEPSGFPRLVTPSAPPALPDDRITCRQCDNYTYSGVCSIARPGGTVSAQIGYRPAGATMLQRCAGFETTAIDQEGNP